MIIENVICAARLLVGYFLLCFVWPSFFLKPVVKEKGLGYRLLFYEVIANMYICVVSYFLAYAKIYYWWTLALFVGALPIILRVYLQRKLVKEKLTGISENIQGIRGGWYGAKVVRRKASRFIKKYLGIFWKDYVKKYFLEWIVLAAILAYVILYLNHLRYFRAGYFASDEEIHLYWITSLVHNQAFPGGLYPHAFHMIIAAISTLFGISPVNGSLCFSVTSASLVFSHFYFLMRKIFPSIAAVFLGMGFFLMSNLFVLDTYIRFWTSIPMEFGLAAFAAMFIALLYYLKDREKKSLLLFGLAVGWTLQIHFYVTIYAVCLCVPFAVVFLITMIKKKIFRKILLGGTLGVAVAAFLFVPGLLLGYEFEGSMRWALSVITGSSATGNTGTDTAGTGDPAADDTDDTAGDAVLDIMVAAAGDTVSDAADTSGTEDSQQDTDLTGSVSESMTVSTQTQQSSLMQKYNSFFDQFSVWMNDHFTNNGSALLVADTEDYTAGETTMKLLLALLAVLFLYGTGACLAGLIRRKKDLLYRGQLYLFVSFAWMMSLLLYLSEYIGLPVLIQTLRVAEFLGLMTMFLFAAPMQIVSDVLSKIPGIRKCQVALTLAAAVCGLGMVWKSGEVKETDLVFNTIRDGVLEGDMNACMHILNEKEDFTWTVISTTNDLSLLRFNGYHTEIIELLEEIESKKEVYIPTADVYVVTNKTYWDPWSAQVSMEDISAGGAASSSWYTAYAYVIMSKLNFLMEKLQEVYPSEVSVYYEDDECVVYYIKQDPYFLLNLSVDYSDKIEEALEAYE